MGKRRKRRPQRQSEAGFPWKGRQGTRDANSRNAPEHYPRPRQTFTPIGQSQRNKETGEPDDTTSITSGSEEGQEKRPAMDLARGLSSARWADDGSLEDAFIASVGHLADQKHLDLRVLHGDGTNTVAKKGGDGLGYSGSPVKVIHLLSFCYTT